ncbi:MAG: PAS domain S-box protein, partial [Melioribacteraceae bacterium]|nr:PAS domain S-box protein [Melioribacteraceae bacterium]
MNQNRSEIESFFDFLNFNRRDLVEFLPLGILFFSENWVIKAINENFAYYFEEQFKDLELEGLNLFSKSIISKTLPLPEIISLKEGKFFEKEITVSKAGQKKIYLIKGSPIIQDGRFKGGIIVVEDFKNRSETEPFRSAPIEDAVSTFNLLESSFFILNSEGKIKSVSENIPASCETFAGSKGKVITELFSSDSKIHIENAIFTTAKENKRSFIELSYYSDREKIDFKCILLPLGIKEDNENLFILLYRENKLLGKDIIGFLSNSDEWEELGSFADVGNDALFKVNLHGNITYWAENAAILFDIKNEDIISKFIGSVFLDIDREYFEDMRSNLLSKGEWEGYLRSERIERNKICKVKIISKISHNITDLFVYCNLIDTQKKNLLAAKEEEELFFKDTVLKSKQMILQINPSGTILFANDKFCDKMNYELDEIRGEQFFNLIDKDFISKNKLYDLETLVTKKELDVLKLCRKNNELLEVSYDINLSRENEEIKYFTFYFDSSNIQDRLFLGTTHSLLYKFPEAIIIVHENKIVKVNSNFCKMLGSELETEFYDKLIYEIIDPSSLENLNYVLRNYSIDNDNVEVSFIRNDKSVLKTNVDKICCSRESSFSVLVVYPLADEKNESVTKLNEIEKSFKDFGPYYWSGTVVDDNITIDYLDSELVKKLGYSRKENYDKSKFMTDIIHPDDAEDFVNSLSQFLDQKETKNHYLDYRVINNRGEIVWVKNSIKLIENFKGELILHGSITDITEWYAEREKLNSRIDDLDKLNTAKEKFTSIISHDLKSPFTSIVGFADLILSDPSYGREEILEFVGHIKEA